MRRIRTRLCAVAVVGILALTGCGSSPTATPTNTDQGSDVAAELDALYQQVEGLNRDQRRAKLIELAKAKGPIDLYASTNPDDAAITYPAFEKSTGVKIQHYRVDATAGRNRLLQEANAGHRGADVALFDGSEMALIDQAGLLLPLKTPYVDDLIPGSLLFNGHSVSSSYNVYVAGWNTKKVPPEKAPKTWEDVLNYPGSWALEIGDYSWFATLVKDYFVKQRGMTEEAAIDLFRKAAPHTFPVDGHTLATQLLTAGEFEMAGSMYAHSMTTAAKNGAPVSFTDPAPVEPVLVRPGGLGITKTADNLPGALLLIDWLISEEGQSITASLNRTPANTKVKGGLDPSIEKLPVDLDVIVNEQERDKWRGIYEDIVRQTGKQPKSE